MHRRQFLALLPATAGLLPLAARSQAPLRPRIKAGFLGGAHSHAIEKWKLMRDSADFDLLGMAEDSSSVRATFEALDTRFLAAAEVVERSELVVVESAVADHARHALLALQAGRHVHVEKPPADNLADLESMIALARRHNRLLQVGYMWRYHPGFERIFEAARQGWLGEVYQVRASIHTQVRAASRPEWAAFPGGGLFELGSHLIDAVVRLLGEPLGVSPLLRRHGPFPDDLRDNNAALFEFPRAIAIVSNSTLQPNAFRHRSFEVLGTHGTATLRPIEPPTLEFDLARAAGPYKAGVQSVPLPPYRRYVDEFAALAAAIRGTKPLAASLDDELRVQRWLLKASEMLLPRKP